MSNNISLSSVVEMLISDKVKEVKVKEHLVREFKKKNKDKQ